MATNYTGNPTATQAPGPQPDPDNFPIVSLPAAGDGDTAASVAQAFKESVDHIAWLKAPRAFVASWIQAIRRYRNGQQQTRFGISHGGLPGGLIRGWQEDWSDAAFSAQTAAPTSGSWARRWKFEYGVTGGTVAGGGIGISEPTFGGGGAPTGPRSVRVNTNPFPNPAATAWCLIETAHAAVVISDDTYLEMEWQGQPGGFSASVGFAAASQIGMSPDNTALLGASIMRRVGDTTWQLYTNSGTSVFTNTGIAIGAPLRFRLEYYGATVSDNGTAQTIAYLDGVKVAQVAGSLGNFAPFAFLRARSATNTTAPGDLGLLRLGSNLNPGDNFI